MIKKTAIFTAFVLVLCLVTCKEAEPVDQDIAVTFQTLTADGSESVQTNTLTLKFNKDITNLAAADITFEAGSTGAVKGALEKTATGTYDLGISGVTATGSVSVSVSKTGYAITGSPKTATVYPTPSTPPPTPPTPEAVTFQTLTANGSASAQTTALTLKFNKDITNLAAADITFGAGTTGAVKGTLTKGSATGTYTLGISSVTATGSVSVSVSKTGYTITGSPKTATVYPTPSTPPPTPPTPDFETVTAWNGLTVPSGTAAAKYNIAQHGKTNVLKVSPKSAKYGYSVLEYNLDAYKNKEVTITMSFDIWLETAGKAAWQLAQSDSTYPLVAGGFNELAVGQWHTITTTTTITPTGSTLYLSSGQLGDTTVAYLANFVITVQEVTVTPPEPPGPPPDPDTLVYTKWPFMVGAAAPTNAFTASDKQYPLLKYFNVLVAENDMKPQSIMPSSKPATFPGTYRWTNADKLVNYAKANNAKVRGHVLIWHSQTPDYFFDVTGSGDAKTTTMTKEVLYDRMEKHIKTVFEHFRGDVLWWDVCNEVVGDDSQPRKAGDPNSGGSWYTKVMENSGLTGINKYEFVLKAFQFARQYADLNGGQDVKLYLTDYNTEFTPGWGKQAEFLRLVDYLIQNDAPIDGVGFQTHINYTFNYTELSAAIDNVATKTRKDGRKLTSQVTELDISIFSDSTTTTITDADLETRLATQATLYKNLFTMFKQKHTEGKLDMVLVWGLADGHSWLNNRPQGRTDYPLLFDRNYQPKDAYLELVR